MSRFLNPAAVTLILLAIPASSIAFKLPPPNGWTEVSDTPDTTSSTKQVAAPKPGTIKKSDDAAKILGTPTSARNLGAPVALDKRTLAEVSRVHTDPGDIPQLKVVVDGKKLDLPLKHTAVKAEITGYVARVEVTQTYQNPFAYPIEAIYVFPLPENSAVDDMRMVIGDRVIQADIKKREEARRTYEDAKKQGYTAALLEQERPNVFTQSVANIEPGTDIDVIIRYVQNLTYDAGEYEFVFPMVVGPRFFPGAPTGGKSGTGWGVDTDQVPDASRISPAVLGGGMRSGHDISIEVLAVAGLPISTWEVPTHDVQYLPTTDGSLALELSPKDSLPNRDFVLRYHVDGKEPQATVLTHRSGKDGYLTLIVQPPTFDIDKLVGNRELIFVVDISGSMSGVPISMCQDAMETAIKNMRPVDTFNVITFAGATGKAFEASRPANDSNIKDALDFIRKMQAGGGTYMLDGIKAALGDEVERGRNRYVFFLTDGYVGNEGEILAATQRMISAIERRGDKAKVFGFGVGSSVNRYLIDGLGKAGKGTGVYATTREDPTLAVNKFYRFIDRSLLEDVEINWGPLAIEQVFPTQIPDLFASRPLILHAKYMTPGSGTITIKGRANGKALELPVTITLPDLETKNEVLGTLWARAKIDWLSRELWSGPQPQVIDSITELGIAHRIVTQYTSFVAVDRSKKVQGDLKTIVQPVETPEGVDPTMAGAGIYNAAPADPSPMAQPPMGMRGAMMESEATTGLAAPRRERAKYKASGSYPAAVTTPAPSPTKPTATELRDKDDAKRSASATLVPADVTNVVKSHQSDIGQCYAQASAEKSGVAGKVTIRWFITNRGVAIQIKVMENTTTSDRLAQCLVAQLKKWTFSAHSGATLEITLPFTFSGN
jgi:Ca-activated chloride channel homolog